MLLEFSHDVVSRRALTDMTEHDIVCSGPEKVFGAIINKLAPFDGALAGLVNHPHSSGVREWASGKEARSVACLVSLPGLFRAMTIVSLGRKLESSWLLG
jgi:hypothetical protein